MYPTDAEYYLQNGRDAFDLSAYGLDNIPDNSETIEPKTMEAPQELLDRFGATKGALVLCELRETKPQSPGSDDILMDLVHLNYFFFYLKGNTIFRIWGESDDGVFEASAADLAESMKKELYDAMASIRMMPVSSDAPAYPMEVNAYFFPENESAPIVTENTIVASEEAVTEALAEQSVVADEAAQEVAAEVVEAVKETAEEVQEVVTGEPVVTEEPKPEEPVVEEVKEEVASEEPVAVEEPKAEEPAVEEVKEEIVSEEPKSEETVVEEVKAEPVSVEPVAVEEPKPEEPAAEAEQEAAVEEAAKEAAEVPAPESPAPETVQQDKQTEKPAGATAAPCD